VTIERCSTFRATLGRAAQIVSAAQTQAIPKTPSLFCLTAALRNHPHQYVKDAAPDQNESKPPHRTRRDHVEFRWQRCRAEIGYQEQHGQTQEPPNQPGDQQGRAPYEQWNVQQETHADGKPRCAIPARMCGPATCSLIQCRHLAVAANGEIRTIASISNTDYDNGERRISKTQVQEERNLLAFATAKVPRLRGIRASSFGFDWSLGLGHWGFIVGRPRARRRRT